MQADCDEERDLHDDLVEVTDFEDRSSPPYERLSSALYELETHRDVARTDPKKDLARLCECGHPRGDHLLGRGSCSAEDECEDGCGCGVFRDAADASGDVDLDVKIESPEGFCTVRVRCAVGAPEDAYKAARAIASFASASLHGPGSREAETLSPPSVRSRPVTAILVNDKAVAVLGRRVSYAEVVAHADMAGNPSVRWRLKKNRGQAEGTLGPGDELAIEDGVEFRVVHTGGG